MKKHFYFAFAVAAALASCSSDDVVNETVAAKQATQTPIGFSVQRQNVTRSTAMEQLGFYNFGVWAYKVNGKNGLSNAPVMEHYLVGYSNGSDLGYDKAAATTWATTTGTVTDHTSPWFYEGLGSSQYNYSGSDFYAKSLTDYMSNVEKQFLHYWDLAYTNTNFYCYAPYSHGNKVTFDSSNRKISIDNSIATDGYDERQNTSYPVYDHKLYEFMYGGAQATNANLHDVNIAFKHIGAQLFIRFYEDIPNYRVEIIDLDDDHGTLATGVNAGYATEGIQAAPAIYNGSGTYAKGTYYTKNNAVIEFSAAAVPTFNPTWTGITAENTPLMFKIPQAGLSTSSVCPANLEDFASTHKVIQEKVATGTQKYSYSPTIYYPVAQPTNSNTGFTFHVSYRIIAEDNNEVITVHNATVFVPAKVTDAGNTTYIAAWQDNTKYTYTFKITKNTNGTTNPNTEIDPTDPTPGDKKALYPIVFDNITIDDYQEVTPADYIISDGTGDIVVPVVNP
jgi:hypothetical protein